MPYVDNLDADAIVAQQRRQIMELKMMLRQDAEEIKRSADLVQTQKRQIREYSQLTTDLQQHIDQLNSTIHSTNATIRATQRPASPEDSLASLEERCKRQVKDMRRELSVAEGCHNPLIQKYLREWR